MQKTSVALEPTACNCLALDKLRGMSAKSTTLIWPWWACGLRSIRSWQS
jgi:hypothetical protein